jgi:hypothetical protein
LFVPPIDVTATTEIMVTPLAMPMVRPGGYLHMSPMDSPSWQANWMLRDEHRSRWNTIDWPRTTVDLNATVSPAIPLRIPPRSTATCTKVKNLAHCSNTSSGGRGRLLRRGRKAIRPINRPFKIATQNLRTCIKKSLYYGLLCSVITGFINLHVRRLDE